MVTIRRSQPKTSHPKRGEIYVAALDPTVGHEIQKTRPVLVIQNDISNRLSEVTIVAPITSTVRFPLSPVHVLLAADQTSGLVYPSVALFNQIRAIDRSRPIQRLGRIDRPTMERSEEAIRICLGLKKI